MRILLMIAGVLILNVVVFGQNRQTPLAKPNEQGQQSSDILYDNIPIKRAIFYQRPEITMQRALKIAEDFIKKEKINIAPYYLAEARLISPAIDQNIKEQFWLLRWVKAGETFSYDIHFQVTMDGKVSRLPSM